MKQLFHRTEPRHRPRARRRRVDPLVIDELTTIASRRSAEPRPPPTR